MEASPHFPRTTSMMVLVRDRDNRLLLVAEKPKRRTFYFETTGQVDIRSMVCTKLEQVGILTSHEYLRLEGVIEHDGKNVFVYTAQEFVTDGPMLPAGMIWYPENRIPFRRLPELDRHVLTMIVDREPIGIALAPS